MDLMTRVCTHLTHDRTHVVLAHDFLNHYYFFLFMSDSTHMDSSSLRLHPRQIDHAHGFFLLFFFVTRSHIDRLHRSVHVSHMIKNIFWSHGCITTNRSRSIRLQSHTTCCHSISHIRSWKNFVLKILVRILRTRDCDPHFVRSSSTFFMRVGRSAIWPDHCGSAVRS